MVSIKFNPLKYLYKLIEPLYWFNINGILLSHLIYICIKQYLNLLYILPLITIISTYLSVAITIPEL